MLSNPRLKSQKLVLVQAAAQMEVVAVKAASVPVKIAIAIAAMRIPEVAPQAAVRARELLQPQQEKPRAAWVAARNSFCVHASNVSSSVLCSAAGCKGTGWPGSQSFGKTPTFVVSGAELASADLALKTAAPASPSRQSSKLSSSSST